MGREMTTADEYREYANECLQWAEQSETDSQRHYFLDMARDWTLAALRLVQSAQPERMEAQNHRLVK
jgi:hypothetical protein